MARRAGLNGDIKATPAIALGAYQVTPLEMAGAYTVFANGGVFRCKPISAFPPTAGMVMAETLPLAVSVSHQALDLRVAWLMVNLLEEVMRTGTASRSAVAVLRFPAAGKTGTSHDGWFAGFTSRLLCIVWVGFDDYRELNLEGARSALPIWTEFMKRASCAERHTGMRANFPCRHGIEQAAVCLDSGKLAGPECHQHQERIFHRRKRAREMRSSPASCDAARATIPSLPQRDVLT